MATIGNTVLTLTDWAKRLDPDGRVAAVIELLAITNEILDDMLWKEGNLPVGHRDTVRTGLPAVYWRRLNEGVATSKSSTAQIDSQCGMLEAWSEVDKDLAVLNGNTSQFRLSEAQAFIEAMNQEMAATLFYGNQDVDEKEFTGLTPGYNSLSGVTAQNIIAGGGTGADNTSIWLVVWGENTITGIFPKGSKAGLQHEDLGLTTVTGGSLGVGAGTRMRAYQDHFQWKPGLVVKDWRYAVRICNIDISAVIADGAGATVKLFEYMIKALHRIPSERMGRPVFYCNRTIRQMVDIQAMNKSNVLLTIGREEGMFKTSFRGVPIKTCDSLLENEALVS